MYKESSLGIICADFDGLKHNIHIAAICGDNVMLLCSMFQLE